MALKSIVVTPAEIDIAGIREARDLDILTGYVKVNFLTEFENDYLWGSYQQNEV